MRRWLLILVLVNLLPASAADHADSIAAAGVVEFNAAYQAWDGARFARAADRFRQAAADAPAQAMLRYWIGAAEFHRFLQLRSLPPSPTNAPAMEAALAAAQAALELAERLDARHAETHALLGTIYGMKIDGSLWRAVRLGPKVQKHRELALKLGADNPRVRYLLGTCQFHTAKTAADRRSTLASLLAAEKLFAEEARRPAGPLDPRWGRSSCLTFIGLTYELLDQRPDAEECFHRALAAHPADHQAREGLARVAKHQ